MNAQAAERSTIGGNNKLFDSFLMWSSETHRMSCARLPARSNSESRLVVLRRCSSKFQARLPDSEHERGGTRARLILRRKKVMMIQKQDGNENCSVGDGEISRRRPRTTWNSRRQGAGGGAKARTVSLRTPR